MSGYCNFAYSLLACFTMGVSGSASFQRRESHPASMLRLLQENNVRIIMTAQNSETLSIRRHAE